MIINPENVPRRTTTIYPDVFKSRIVGRVKQAVGNAAGLKNFGVNLVTLKPGSCSALRHWHQKQDEFIYIIQGEATLITNAGEQILTAGMMAGFPAGEADGHQLVNKSPEIVIYLEVGDRTPGDEVCYPDDDLIVKSSDDGGWILTHKDGTLYEI
ncbi:cupin domain-containing protein [Sphaerospermopsis aphanizomenoides BCCUSP55]|uniref:cupin domain-containing protein n=1 Tax=Sphaerospermopsis aphanizomenoides TaxID=459663 RepID=UPI000AE181BA|nr:cupin domain-containing protein [Sphaerospermopsis aphanizomenoides]MBK1989982.1 cupin domain-containing protein [Sphaerospermopsis aphanizomenoides BCCUSP55]